MKSEERKEVVKKISEAIRKTGLKCKAYLYGSEARGESRPDSDFDVLVLLPDNNEEGTFSKRQSAISGSLYEVWDWFDFKYEISPLILPESVWNKRRTPFTINVTNDRIEL